MKPLKIYLIEDDNDHAELIKFTLQKFEQAQLLHRSSDGEEALSLLENIANQISEKPDLILLDINLPKISGLEVLKKIKSNENLWNIPVLALTTSNSERDKKEAYKNHVNSYLVKPVDFDELQDLMKSILNYWGQFNCV